MNKNKFHFLKLARERWKLTLRDVEDATGISNVAISQIESGKVDNPSVFKVLKLAKAYSIDPISLWDSLGMSDKVSPGITISGLSLKEAQIINSILIILRKSDKE